ncbi:MAG: sigma-70 family RNA polymerase sigma factor [Planctomycetes bacterium]|nr:sigma-70 family RNA polymerase sigma factor [Planctomycetota bacterium]MBL7008908.1 sigma-70 family RNA polymerase sigma factor [Planctomycetota bacterium]
MSAHPADLETARRIAAGDEEAAAGFFRELSGEMFGYARKMLGDPSAAEDALQEAMLGALRSIGRYDGRVSLRSWAFGVLRHKITDAHRKRGRDFVFSSDDPEAERFQADGHWNKDVTFQPWDENAELMEIVRRCMEDLPHNQREALVLRALEGLSTREAAGLLELSEDNLRQVLHRARASVRRCADQKAGDAA